ncbi:MAG: PspA/IM30 family protein [Kastovskya adunca ATA6-11-RM4]|jgi:phage shock protein A|nr:PspA/IM30 family protein [Kastovskya adunca ATA6-11-RM4]
MALIDRILRVIRGNINSLVGQAEDPEKVLEQAVEDMQQDLIQMRQAVAQAIATQKRTERQSAQAQATAEEWYRRAQIALNSSDDNLAREALTRRKTYLQTAQAMQTQLSQQSGIVNKLKDDMRTLESKISEAKTRKDLFVARARSAQASQKINEMLGTVGTGSASSAFERMEDRVLQLEAQSEAMQELGTDDLDKKFAALEGSDDIEAELAAMKTNRITGSDQAQLPATEARNSSDPAIEAELNQLRSTQEEI